MKTIEELSLSDLKVLCDEANIIMTTCNYNKNRNQPYDEDLKVKSEELQRVIKNEITKRLSHYLLNNTKKR